MNFPEYLSFLVLLLMRILSCAGECEKPMTWERTQMLDENVTIKWNYTDTDATILVIAKTKGFVGFGFSETKRILNNTDIVIGWIGKQGNASVQDLFLKDNKSQPIIDTKQSYSIISSGQNDTFTCICFKRKLNTCDKKDFNIINGTLEVVWITNDKIPENNQTVVLTDVASIKGPKSIFFLSITFPRPTFGVQNVDLLAKKTKVTSTEDTLYWCSHFKLAPTRVPYYLLGFEPILQKHKDIRVHHILLLTCPTELFNKIFKNISESGYNCLDETKTQFQNPCQTVEALWAVGGENQYFPPDFAIPHGSTDKNTYFKMEIHYTILPNAKEEIDESGIRLLVTTKKRPKIGGILAFGMHILPLMTIPPGQPAFPIAGICDNFCIQKYFPKDGINIVALRFHAHLVGIKHIIHRYKNDKELQPISDEHFDFDFQGFRFLKKEIKISSSETIVGECVYDTSSRNTTTILAMPTKQEMCRHYIIYYPRINMSYCVSLLKPKDVFDLVGIEEIGPVPGSEMCNGSQCPSPFSIRGNTGNTKIKKPEKFANQTLKEFMLNFTDWNSQRLNTLQQLYHSQQQRLCIVDDNPVDSTDKSTVDYPKAKPYQQDEC